MEEIIKYLKKTDPSALKNAIDAYNCFEPYNKDVEAYARATAFIPENCEEEVIDILTSLNEKSRACEITNDLNKEEHFNAQQNAIVAKDAERYYRTMIKGDVNSWNLRDTHMMDTLERLMEFYNQQSTGKKPKAIVWAHNTHIGDARFTDMIHSGMINLGQLVRQKKGINNAVLVGFSTFSGTVIAANQWGAKMEKMDVPPAKEGSWDNILHNADNQEEYDLRKEKQVQTTAEEGTDKLIIFPYKDNNNHIKEITEEKIDNNIDSNKDRVESRGQRAIGVVYNPKYERFGNYVPTQMVKRYDALIFIDKTNAVSPLHMQTIKSKDVPDTFPTGI
jgi:erythromycin esterase-like protein